MRIICLITVGAILLTIADAAGTDGLVGEIAETTSAARLSRALVLQPVSRIKVDDDDGPFDWLANMFKGMVGSKTKKRVPLGPPPMIGPIKIPGVDDEVYIKQLGGYTHMNPRVIVRVMNHQKGPVQTPMGMAIQPSQYYTLQPAYPLAPTHQVPIKSAGFVPIQSNPTVAWPLRPQVVHRPHYPLNYNKNHHPNGGYNFSPQNPHPQRYYPQPQHPPSSHQSYYDPYSTGSNYQNPYGSYDFDNSLQHGGRSYHYGGESLRATNYPHYAPINEHAEVNHDSQEIRNQTISSGEVYDNSHETSVQYNVDDSSKEDTSSTDAVENLKEIYRPDRMVSTNPTWKNRFWTNTLKTTTASPTTQKDDGEKKWKSSTEKFSSTEIKEIVAPNLERWKEKSEQRQELERNSDSRMDVDGIEMSDGRTLGKGESHEYIEKRNLHFKPTESVLRRIKISSTKQRQHWKPAEPKTTRPSPVYIPPATKDKDEIQPSPVYQSPRTKEEDDTSENSDTKSSTARSENATPEVLQKVMNLTADHSWKNTHGDRKKSLKTYGRKTGALKNGNRRVRIVESVQSSVSMTSSRGKQSKTKSKS